MGINAEAWVALAALLFSLISFAVTVYEKLRSNQENLIRSLQGQKENIAYTAIKVSSGQWQSNIFHEPHKDDMIASLCLAWLIGALRQGQGSSPLSTKSLEQGTR